MNQDGKAAARDEHRDGIDDGAAPFLENLRRNGRVNGIGRGGCKAPEQAIERHSELAGIPSRGKQERTAKGKRETQGFAATRKTLGNRTGEDHEQDKRERLENRSRRGVRNLDRHDVAERVNHHAEGRRKEQTNAGGPGTRPDRLTKLGEALPLARNGEDIDEEQERCRELAHAEKPQRSHPIAIHQELCTCAGKAPACAAQKREENAAPHVVCLRHSLPLRDTVSANSNL